MLIVDVLNSMANRGTCERGTSSRHCKYVTFNENKIVETPPDIRVHVLRPESLQTTQPIMMCRH